jgi:hypothetical protein
MNLMKYHGPTRHVTRRERGNILFAILIAIGLMAALSIAVTEGFSGAKSTSDQEMKLHAEKILRYADSVKRAVQFMYATKGISETEFLFAHSKNHTDYGDDLSVSPELQVFGTTGGGASFWWPIPDGINDGSPWDFTGRTLAPEVGVNLTQDLMIYLPNITEEFCRAVNGIAGYEDGHTIPLDQSGCGFSGTLKWANTYGSTFNSFSSDFDADGFITPMPYGCVQCDADNLYYFYYVLHER